MKIWSCFWPLNCEKELIFNNIRIAWMFKNEYQEVMPKWLIIITYLILIYIGWNYILNFTFHLTPFKYKYRPGTISEWLAKRLQNHAARRRKTHPRRVYMDGCFDMMHYGHANALRQAKALGDILVVGLISDNEIKRFKGCLPVLNEKERLILVNAIKWVDEVILEVPYELTEDFTQELFNKHKIDYIIHGDDPCLLPDGTDAYAYAKKLGRFKMIKRTEGVSTTDIVGRMLTCTRFNVDVSLDKKNTDLSNHFSEKHGGGAGNSDNKGKSDVISNFMPTSMRIVQFSNSQGANPGSKIIYIDGAFDVFHGGHVEILKKAKKLGDFLLVGIHEDDVVTKRRGLHMPIMNLHERSLSVLACKYVDEVIIGVTPIITDDLIKTFNISLVVRGTSSETQIKDNDRYKIPKEKGIFMYLESSEPMTTKSIINRILQNHTIFQERQSKKLKSEKTYYESNKTYVQEI